MTWTYVKTGGLILIPIALLILPAGFFDHGQSMCLSQLLAGTECPGCGMTRSIMHYIHLDFATGYSYNKISVIVFPILILLWYQELSRNIRKIIRFNKS